MDAFIELFDPLSMPLLFLVWGAAGVVFVFGIEFVVQRRVHPDVRERVSTTTAVVIQVLAVFYSVLVAFVIVGERSAISDANDNISAEGAALAGLYHDVGGFPEPVRGDIQRAIAAYDLSVLNHDFRTADETGAPSAQTTAKLDNLYRTVEAAEPAVGQSKFYTQTISDLSDVTKARRGRIADATDTIPGPLFFLVVLVSVLVLAVATLLNTRERRAHIALLTGLAIVVSFNLALIVALEHPFGGAIAISDQPLRVATLVPGQR
jgi:drug/metabolite transporter (DMT)-like permease